MNYYSMMAVCFACCMAPTAFGAASSGCSAAQIKTVEPYVVAGEKLVCLFAQIELGKTEPKELSLVCSIPIDSVVSFLDAKQKGHALAAAQQKDAGK